MSCSQLEKRKTIEYLININNLKFKIMGARPVKMTVNNNTSQTLKHVKNHVTHGRFTKDPPEEIESTGYWACSSNNAATIGPEGTVTYKAADGSFTVEFYWNHPYGSATSSYRVTPTPSDAIGYDIKGSFKGHDQEITFDLYVL
jgi:hypothetical protein